MYHSHKSYIRILEQDITLVTKFKNNEESVR